MSSVSSTYTVHPIRLVGDGKRLDIREPDVLTTARNQGEQIARSLGFPFVDRMGH